MSLLDWLKTLLKHEWFHPCWLGYLIQQCWCICWDLRKICNKWKLYKICKIYMIPHQQTYKAKSSKTAKPNLANQTCQTKPKKPNLTNQTCQNRYTEPNLPNWTNHNFSVSTYVQYLWALDLQCLEWFCDVREFAWFFNLLICLKQWTPGSVVPLAIFHLCIYWAARIVAPIYCPEIV